MSHYGRPTQAEIKKKRRRTARHLLRRDASPTEQVVLAQAAETKVVVAAVEEVGENQKLWRSVLAAFLVGFTCAAWILLHRAELQLILK